MANNEPSTLGCVLVLCVKLRLQRGSKFIPLPELLPPMLHNNFEIVVVGVVIMVVVVVVIVVVKFTTKT